MESIFVFLSAANDFSGLDRSFRGMEQNGLEQILQQTGTEQSSGLELLEKSLWYCITQNTMDMLVHGIV